MAKSKSNPNRNIRWKVTKNTTETKVRKPAWESDEIHEPAELHFQPYKHIPTAVESWLDSPDEEDE